MVVIMKRGFTPEELEKAILTMEEGGVKVMVSKGAETTILGAEGNADGIDRVMKFTWITGGNRYVLRVPSGYVALIGFAFLSECNRLIITDLWKIEGVAEPGVWQVDPVSGRSGEFHMVGK